MATGWVCTQRLETGARFFDSGQPAARFDRQAFHMHGCMPLPGPGDCLPAGSAVFVLRGAVGPVHRGRAQGQVFGGPPRHALAPQPKRAGLELAAHERDDGALVQTELQRDGLKRRAVFSRHFDDAGDVFVCERGGLGKRRVWGVQCVGGVHGG